MRRGAGAFWLLQILPALLILVAFLVLPLLVLGRISVYPGERSFGATGWSWHQYAKFFGDSFYVSVLGETLLYGVIVTLITAVFGFPVGYSLARMPAHRRRWRVAIVILPLTLSLVVNVFGWLVILGGEGMINRLLVGLGILDAPMRFLFNRGAVILVLAHTFLPFQILSIMSVIANIDLTLEEAAANLRARRSTTLRRIILPLAWPGIVSGSTIVFILTISAFVTPRLIGGARVPMLGSLILEQIVAVLNWPFGAAMSFILLAIALVLVFFLGRSLAAPSTSR